ncbi:MAG TPA: hypothetical protein VJ986_06345 [Gaiellaceae bacterium]|nr:hypothetical protein [Gaiellaceae bacterium]
MTATRRKTGNTGRAALLLIGLAAALVLALGAGPAAAAPVGTQQATNTCWKDVVNDWLQHRPNVVGSYPIPCYTQAIQHLNAYPDIQGYSNAPDDIHRALLAAYHNDRGNGPGSGAMSTTTSTSSGGNDKSNQGAVAAGSNNNGGGGSSGAPPVHKSIVTRAFDAVGPGNAQSIPLPLLVLAGLALLLLLAAAGTWLAKRIQERRMTPATAPAPTPRHRD